MERQKYDPFAVVGETHCGDCDETLTVRGKHLGEWIIYHGLRCDQCYAVYIKQEMEGQHESQKRGQAG